MKKLNFGIEVEESVKSRVIIDVRTYNDTIAVIFEKYNILNEVFATYKEEHTGSFTYNKADAKLGANVYTTTYDEKGNDIIKECFAIYEKETGLKVSDTFIVSQKTTTLDPEIEAKRQKEELRLKKLDEEAKMKNKDIKMVSEKKNYNEQTIEERVAQFMKEDVKICSKDSIIRMFSEETQCYSILEEEEDKMKGAIMNVLTKMKAEKYKKPSHISSINEYLKIIAKSDKKLDVKMSEKYFCVNVKTVNYSMVKAYMSIERINRKDFIVKIQEPNKSLNCKYYLSNIIFDSSDVKTMEGKDVRFEGFFRNETYSLRVDNYENSELYTEYLGGIFYNEEFEKLARIIIGSYFTERNLGLACYIPGTAGVGKSIFQSIIKSTMEGVVNANLKIDNKNANQFSNLKLMTHNFAITPESMKDINMDFFKQIMGGGGDTVKFEKKGGREVHVQFDKICLIVNANYNELPVVSADNDAFIRRLACVKPTDKKPEFIIDNFYKYFLDGGEAVSDKYENGFKVFKGHCQVDMVKWMLSGALELMYMGSFNLNKFSDEVRDFKLEMFQKMSSSSNFFEFFKIKDSEKCILKDHIYEVFKKFKRNNNYSERKFDAEIREEFKRATGSELRTARITVDDTFFSNGKQVNFKQTVQAYFIDFEGLKFNNDYYYTKADVVSLDQVRKDKALYSKVEAKIEKESLSASEVLKEVSDSFDYDQSIPF